MKKQMVLVLTATMLFSTLSSGAKADSRILNIMGNNRTETSARAAKLSDDSSIEDYGKIRGNYVFANSKYFSDALSAYNLVFDKNARLILIDNSTDIDKYINGANNAYIVGGTGAISSQMENKIRSRFKMVKRYGGSNRYITNSLILDDCNFTKLGIADGRNYPDALAASGYLRENGYGLKLVNGSNKYVLDSRYEGICTFGGVNSVKYAMGHRIAGKNRYETSQKINSMFSPKSAAMVYGEDFPDAMAALNVIFRNYQGNDKKPTAVVLSKGSLNNNDKQYLSKMSEVYLVGGRVKDVFKSNDKIDEKTNVSDKISKNPKPKPIEESGLIIESETNNLPVKKLSYDKYMETFRDDLTDRERELAKRVNDYRESKGLTRLPISKSLTKVARSHVWDQNNNYRPRTDSRGISGNFHGWSDNGPWKGVIYTGDHHYAELMWSKPSELSEYTGYGYEISAGGGFIRPKEALELWKHSSGHNAVIVGEGAWAGLTTMGVGIDGEYSNIWFGKDTDPAGYYSE